MIFQYFYSGFTVKKKEKTVFLQGFYMTDLAVFYELKKSVLERYKTRYSYFEESWKKFSSQDILNLIDDIQENTKNSVSEKWVYTHLKPENNEKLPRKDMLDILSVYVGKKSWNDFKLVFINEHKSKPQKNNATTKINTRILIVSLFFLLLFLLWKFVFPLYQSRTIELNEKYSNDSISSKKVKAFTIQDSVLTEIEIKNSRIAIQKDEKIVVKSPFYKEKTIDLQKTPNIEKVVLEPDDYVNILQGFIKSDIKDWKKRKEQLDRILDDNLEVIVMLQNNLGAEYFNKEEFSQKVIIPTPSLKKMNIVAVEKNKENKIIFIRLIKK